jgi:RNA polymerase sigma factor (sigma-70 family)
LVLETRIHLLLEDLSLVSEDAHGMTARWVTVSVVSTASAFFTRTPGLRPDEHAESAECHREVREALRALPHDLREAITLFVHEGMSHAEIAKLAGCSPKAVETRIYRARHLLRAHLT